MGKKTNINKHRRVEKDKIICEGTVLETFRSAKFSVKVHSVKSHTSTNTVDNEMIVLCTLCGKMKENFIKIVPGDIVEIELGEYDMMNGRIITRIRS